MTTSVYLHVPFCKSICPYCDFCKIVYNKKLVKEYFVYLRKEVSTFYKGERLKTIYIGGGTPSALSLSELKELFLIIDLFKKEKNCEVTIEVNPDTISLQKLQFLRDKVNRISVGVQTFNDQHLFFLNRNYNKKVILSKIKLMKEIGFKNISIDLIYGFKNQTLDDLKKDLLMVKKLDVSHLSIYNLIVKENTVFSDYEGDPDLDYQMYCLLEKELTDFIHYEISSFGEKGFFSRHNLVYWHNQPYYGFGLGASGFVDLIRYQNSDNFNLYKKGVRVLEKVSFSDMIVNQFIMNLRLLKGISEKAFINRYGISFLSFKNVERLIMEKKLIFKNGYLRISKKKMFVSNEVLLRLVEDYEVGNGKD